MYIMYIISDEAVCKSTMLKKFELIDENVNHQ